ncbi:hypothetical protein AGMMS50249_0640 [candidate division SR1 bacterium]|nr:hypothetical protein AGMMS50249_0640 [candidate division SR1 bacterium]
MTTIIHIFLKKSRGNLVILFAMTMKTCINTGFLLFIIK